MQTPNIKLAAALLGCTEAQAKKQFAANVSVLENMRIKALQTGKRQGGYTAKQLADRIKVIQDAIN